MDIQITPEADQNDPFTVLGDEMSGVDDFWVIRSTEVYVGHVVPQLIECFQDYLEGLPFIMTFQIFDVLKQKSRRPLCFQNPGYVKEQRSLGIALKSMLSAQRVLLRHSGKGEWLAGKAGQQYVMIGNVLIYVPVRLLLRDIRVAGESNFSDVLVEHVLIWIAVVVGLVSSYRILVPLAGEHAFAADFFKSTANATYPGEQVHKTELMSLGAKWPG